MTNMIVIPKNEWNQHKSNVQELMGFLKGVAIIINMDAMSSILAISDKVNDQLEHFETEFIPEYAGAASGWYENDLNYNLTLNEDAPGLPAGADYYVVLFK
jgi:hypothetical protein